MVTYAPEAHQGQDHHESVTRRAIASQLAELKDFEFGGEYDRSGRYSGPVYFVPAGTLVTYEAGPLGISGEQDLFGGVVPYPFVATKAISQPLFEPGAHAPDGWSRTFGQRVSDATLSGFAAFARADARRAGACLLESGPVRLKPTRATGGHGQSVVSSTAELDAALEPMDEAALIHDGLVLEENLTEVTTYSIGQVRVADLVASYYGTQSLTPDNGGEQVYGGSDLVIVRGDFEALLQLDVPAAARLAVAQARAFDAAATRAYPGLFASRRNYDVAQGLGSTGKRLSGVLEQSWRLGGASSAEVAALQAFRSQPSLRAVHASSLEIYGERETPPGATVTFRGRDDRGGPFAKCTLVESCRGA